MKSPIRTYIVDDEAPARRELRFLLEQLPEVTVVGEAGSGSQALTGIREAKPELVFLDIQMPGINGMELAKTLAEMKTRPLLVFATAYSEYAIDAFEVDAIDYLCKPFTLERVGKTVARAQKARSMETASLPTRRKAPPEPCRRICLYRGEVIVPTLPEQILFIHVQDGEVVVNTANGLYHSRCTLTELEQKLSAGGFIRPHRSYLVNISHVVEVIPWFNGSYKLVMNDSKKTRIPVSRYHQSELKKHFDL